MSSAALVKYDAMCSAIAAAYAVDEVKDIRDQAAALELYARQARNVEAERQACEIRLRAERKAGQLLGSMDRAKGRPEKVSRRTTLSDVGISRDQSSRWQKLGAVPDETFERELADPTHMPATNGIIRAAAEPKVEPVAPEALWLWGRLRDFERDGLIAKEPADVLATLTPEMLDDVHALAPRVAAWLRRIGEIP